MLVTMLWAFCRREWSPRFGKVLTVSLVISTAYLGWTLIGQRIAEVRGVDFLAARGIEPERLLAGPTRLMGPTIITSMYRFWEMQRR